MFYLASAFKLEGSERAMGKEQATKCPKCGGEMKPGSTSGDFRILKSGDLVGDSTEAFYCQDCGFIELYKAPSTREPRRWVRPRSEPKQSQHPAAAEEPQEPEEKDTKRETGRRLVR